MAHRKLALCSLLLALILPVTSFAAEESRVPAVRSHTNYGTENAKYIAGLRARITELETENAQLREQVLQLNKMTCSDNGKSAKPHSTFYEK